MPETTPRRTPQRPWRNDLQLVAAGAKSLFRAAHAQQLGLFAVCTTAGCGSAGVLSAFGAEREPHREPPLLVPELHPAGGGARIVDAAHGGDLDEIAAAGERHEVGPE